MSVWFEFLGRSRAWPWMFTLCLSWLLSAVPACSQDLVPYSAGVEALSRSFGTNGPSQSLWLADSFSFNEFRPGRFKKSGTPKPNVKFGNSGFPGGITFDEGGNLWGSFRIGGPSGYGWVFEMTPGDLRALVKRHRLNPSVSFVGSGHDWIYPADLVRDSSGNLWTVADDTSAYPEIIEFTPEQFGRETTVAPAAAIQIPNCSYLGEMQFDQLGDLWVTGSFADTGSGAIYKLAPGQLARSGTVTPALTVTLVQEESTFEPNGIRFDQSGNLWVADYNALPGMRGKLLLFAASDLLGSGDIAIDPTVTIDSVTEPRTLAVDGGGNLWVGDFGIIREFTANQIKVGGSPEATVVLKPNKKGKNFNGTQRLVFGPTY